MHRMPDEMIDVDEMADVDEMPVDAPLIDAQMPECIDVDEMPVDATWDVDA